MVLTNQKIAETIVKSILAGREDIPLDIHFSDDLYMDSLKYCDSKIGLAKIHAYTDEEISETRGWNGLYISPGNTTATQHILISNRQVDENFLYVSTVAHEAKHALNRTDFCKKYCEGDFDEYFTHPLAAFFDEWDEYSARKTGHSTFLKITMPYYLGYSEKEIQSLIINRDLPARIKEIYDIINSDETVYIRIRKALGVLARFSVWKELYNLNYHEVDHRLLKAMSVFNKYSTVNELDLEDIQGTLLELEDHL